MPNSTTTTATTAPTMAFASAVIGGSVSSDRGNRVRLDVVGWVTAGSVDVEEAFADSSPMVHVQAAPDGFNVDGGVLGNMASIGSNQLRATPKYFSFLLGRATGTTTHTMTSHREVT